MLMRLFRRMRAASPPQRPKAVEVNDRTPPQLPLRPLMQRPLTQRPLSPGWDQPLNPRAARIAPVHENSEATALPTDDLATLRGAFTPRQPKRWRHLFVGRKRQIDRAMAALEDEHAHIVLFGERGRGKTSLANVLADMAIERGYTVVHCAGSADTTLDSILDHLFSQVSARQIDAAAANTPVGAARDSSNTGVNRFINRIRQIRQGQFLLFIDEFDRITDAATHRQLAEAIKNLSDVQARITFMIVGVATSLEALLGEHPSIQRNILGIHVPLLTSDEAEASVDIGAAAANIAFGSEAKAIICNVARGLPYFLQLFCLYAARNALKRGSRIVEVGDVVHAAETILEEREMSLVRAYERAVGGANGPMAVRLLFALADAESDVFGVLGSDTVRAAVKSLDEAQARPVLDWLCSEQGGAVLQPTVSPRTQGLSFTNANFRQYVLLRNLLLRRGPAPR